MTIRKNRRAVNVYLVPKIGALPVAAIATHDVLSAVRGADEKSREYARKAAAAARQIVRLAIAEGLREEGRLLDLDLRHNLPRHQGGHNPAATTPVALRHVLGVIHGLRNPVTRAALLLCCYTAQRPGNVVAMRWDELDLAGQEWDIPGGKMKIDRGRPHVVPLAAQALALLDGLRPLTNGVGYVFLPLAQQKTPHLARDTLSKALRDAGLRGIQTPHGLRAVLRTVARERLGAPWDVLEAQLAHAKHGEVAAAYDRADFLQERHAVMQKWADYLDGLLK